MLEVFAATLPVFLLIFVGWGTVKTKFLSDGFWREAEKFIYFLLFPALLFSSVAKANLGGLDIGAIALAIWGAMAVMTAALLLVRPFLSIDGPSFTSLYQGAIRMNTYLGLGIAAIVGGKDVAEATAVAIAVFVPSANLLCVSILVRYASADGASISKTLIALAKNPLIIAILAGIAVNLTGIVLPSVLAEALSILGGAALALGLLAVGAGLDFSTLRASGLLTPLSAVLKLAVMPALALLFCQLLGLTGPGALAVILLNALPAAGASYILARQMGGNAPLMANLITVQTGLSLISLPLILTWLTP